MEGYASTKGRGLRGNEGRASEKGWGGFGIQQTNTHLPRHQEAHFNRLIMFHPSQRDPVPDARIKSQSLAQLAPIGSLCLDRKSVV